MRGGWFDEPATSLVFKVDGPNSTVPLVPNCAYEPVGGFQVGVWYHATGVMDYTTHLSSLYVNGTLVDSQTTNVVPITRAIPTSLSFSAVTAPQLTLDGNMDEVRIWSRALTQQEILSDYENCLSGAESLLELYYHCNDGGPVALDSSPNGRDGNVIAPGTGWSVESAPVSQSCGLQATLDLGDDIYMCAGNAAHFATVAGIFINYQWTGDGLSCYSCPNPEVFPINTTTYILIATAGSGCILTDTVEVFVSPSTLMDLGNDLTICKGDSAQFSYITPDLSTLFQWTPAAGLSCDTCPNPEAFPINTTTYVLTATAANGCVTKDTVKLTVARPPLIELGNDITLCEGASTHFSFIAPDSYTVYQWLPAGSLSCSTCPDPEAFPWDTTEYYLTATTPQGCVATDSVTVYVKDDKPKNVALFVTGATCEQGGTVIIEVTDNDNTDLQYNFANRGFSDSPAYYHLPPDNYPLFIRHGDNGCPYFTTVAVNGDQNLVFIPNAFTPDGNEANNMWGIKGSCIKEISCRVFNRWGEEVVTLIHLSEEWDGTFEGQMAPDGLYTYVAEVTYYSQQTEVLTGFISLLR